MCLQFTLQEDLFKSKKQCATRTGVYLQLDSSYGVL